MVDAVCSSFWSPAIREKGLLTATTRVIGASLRMIRAGEALANQNMVQVSTERHLAARKRVNSSLKVDKTFVMEWFHKDECPVTELDKSKKLKWTKKRAFVAGEMRYRLRHM